MLEWTKSILTRAMRSIRIHEWRGSWHNVNSLFWSKCVQLETPRRRFRTGSEGSWWTWPLEVTDTHHNGAALRIPRRVLNKIAPKFKAGGRGLRNTLNLAGSSPQELIDFPLENFPNEFNSIAENMMRFYWIHSHTQHPIHSGSSLNTDFPQRGLWTCVLCIFINEWTSFCND